MKNIAVVGCGHWGKNLVRNFAELGYLAAICEPNSSVADEFSEKFSVPALTFHEILKSPRIKGIVLAVPAPLHESFALDAMNAGKHVYVEKPIAMSQVEAKSMITAADKNNVHLMVGHLLQYHPVFVKLRTLVLNRSFGNIRHISSSRLSLGKIRSEEDVIWSFAPHDISMVLSLMNERPSSVRAEAAYVVQSDIADTASIQMDFSNRVKANVSVSWIHPFKEQKLIVVAENAMVVFDDAQPWDKKLALFNHKVDFSAATLQIVRSDVEYISVPEAEPLREECKYFYELIAGNVPPLTDGQEGLRVLRVLEAASLSLRAT